MEPFRVTVATTTGMAVHVHRDVSLEAAEAWARETFPDANVLVEPITPARP